MECMKLMDKPGLVFWGLGNDLWEFLGITDLVQLLWLLQIVCNSIFSLSRRFPEGTRCALEAGKKQTLNGMMYKIKSPQISVRLKSEKTELKLN